jgi:hypothetical protein
MMESRQMQLALGALVVLAACSGDASHDQGSTAQHPPTTSVAQALANLDTGAASAVRQALHRPGASIVYRWIRRPASANGAHVLSETERREGVAIDSALPVSRADVARAAAFPTGLGRSVVVLQLEQSAQLKLLAATTDREGREVEALLNGVLVTSAVVRGPLLDYLPLTADLPTDLADSVTRRINTADVQPATPPVGRPISKKRPPNGR